jgi:hypothetical protein
MVRRPLSILDDAVILGEYLCLHDEKLPAAIVERAIFLGAVSAREPKVPYHRLIPLNLWRKSFRDGIPEKIQCLFPWYDVWSEEDELILDKITHSVSDLEQDSFLNFETEDIDHLKKLFDDIRKDTLFYNHLKQQNRLLHQSVNAIGEDYALAMFFHAEKSEPRVELPKAVTEKGFSNIASALLNADNLELSQQYELLFLAAYAGPELEDEERLECFEMVADYLESESDLKSDTLIGAVKQWICDRLDDDRMADKIYDRWIDLLERHAEKFKTGAVYRDGLFQDSVKQMVERIELLDTPKAEQNNLDGIIIKLSDIYPDQFLRPGTVNIRFKDNTPVIDLDDYRRSMPKELLKLAAKSAGEENDTYVASVCLRKDDEFKGILMCRADIGSQSYSPDKLTLSGKLDLKEYSFLEDTSCVQCSHPDIDGGMVDATEFFLDRDNGVFSSRFKLQEAPAEKLIFFTLSQTQSP